MHLGRSWIRATRLLNIDYPWWLSSETKLTPPDRNLDSDSRPNSFMNIIYPNLDEELNKPNLEGSLQSSSNVPSDCHCSQSRENAPTNSLHQRASMWLFAQTGNFEFLLIFIFIVLCCLERNNCSLSFWVLMSLHHGHWLFFWWYTLSCLLTARTAIVCDLKLFLRLRTLSSLLDGLFVLSPGGWGFALTRQFLWILFLTGYIPVYWVYEKIKYSKAIHIIYTFTVLPVLYNSSGRYGTPNFLGMLKIPYVYRAQTSLFKVSMFYSPFVLPSFKASISLCYLPTRPVLP